MTKALPEPWGALLRKVSRSFYLTLRILPGSIRPQIGLAYLLARMTDTIADTRIVPLDHRRAALRETRNAIRAITDGRHADAIDFGELADARGVPADRRMVAERALLEGAGEMIDLLGNLVPEDRQRVCDLLEIITRGQDADLSLFGIAGKDRIVALESDDDLEEYTYRVAGCVGEFWTKMCRAHLFPRVDLDETFLLCSGIRFGKGLQLVNILRDLPEDLRQGRCYLPLQRLAGVGLEPSALLNPRSMGALRPLYTAYVRQAEELLAAGWTYTNALPRNQMRVRLACAWPSLIGMKTLARLRLVNVLDASQRVKVSRGEVRSLMIRSVLCYHRQTAWDRLFLQAGADPPARPL